jgi:hypothetical protein
MLSILIHSKQQQNRARSYTSHGMQQGGAHSALAWVIYASGYLWTLDLITA